MQNKPQSNGRGVSVYYNTKESDDAVQVDDGLPWFEGINKEAFFNKFKNPKSSKGRTQHPKVYVTKFTAKTITEIKEKNPEFFDIETDVYNSMIDTALSLYVDRFLKSKNELKLSKKYKFAKKMYSLKEESDELKDIEDVLEGMLEQYMERKIKNKDISMEESIGGLIEKVKDLIEDATEAGAERLQRFIDEDLHDKHKLTTVWERVRKRNYRAEKVGKDQKIYAVK